MTYMTYMTYAPKVTPTRRHADTPTPPLALFPQQISITQMTYELFRCYLVGRRNRNR
jgi:hypothetical protein